MKNLFLDLYETIELRKKSDKQNSYTKKLFKEGVKLVILIFSLQTKRITEQQMFTQIKT